MGLRRVNAVLADVAPALGDGVCGVSLSFRPTGARSLPARIDDFARLDRELSLETVQGLGKVLRLLRAARLAAPRDPRRLLGRALETSRRLEAALGTRVLLHLRARRLRSFRVWTEHGVEQVDDVAEVIEHEEGYWVMRRRGQPPVYVPRSSVVRTHTASETWHQVLQIERC